MSRRRGQKVRPRLALLSCYSRVKCCELRVCSCSQAGSLGTRLKKVGAGFPRPYITIIIFFSEPCVLAIDEGTCLRRGLKGEAILATRRSSRKTCGFPSSSHDEDGRSETFVNSSMICLNNTHVKKFDTVWTCSTFFTCTMENPTL